MEYKTESIKYFDDVETIIDSPLHFKSKLCIGGDAYTTEKVKKGVFEAWDVAGVAMTASGVAQSSAVASTFFAPTGFLAALGFGTAVTPIGWVVAFGVLSGGAWFGITKYFKQSTSDKVTVIPNFINTPLDVLGLGFFDLLAPLTLKFSHVDGEIHDTERKVIYNFFVKEWGYNTEFVNAGLDYIESNISEFSIKNQCQFLADFTKNNPDCNHKSMSDDIITFLNNIMEADGRIDEREEMAIEKVKSIFNETNKLSITKEIKGGVSSLLGKVRGFVNTK